MAKEMYCIAEWDIDQSEITAVYGPYTEGEVVDMLTEVIEGYSQENHELRDVSNQGADGGFVLDDKDDPEHGREFYVHRMIS